MSGTDEKRMATNEMRLAIGVSLLEHRRNDKISDGVKEEPVAITIKRRRLEWFRHVERRYETETVTADEDQC